MLIISHGWTLAAAQTGKAETIRICDESGCSDRPRNSASFEPQSDVDPETEKRMEALEQAAKTDPRASYDLALRYFRGDGVRRSSYKALQWMREAGDRGDLNAQKALGRLYLSGLEEMGSDPQEAEKWLMIAASRGDRESKRLLEEAKAAKKANTEYRRWLDLRRAELAGWWYHGWGYRAYWRGDRWWYY
jgi:TPR repeat protein